METIEQVREFFTNDRFATENNAVIDEIGDGYARCSMDIMDKHKNAMGTVMGGATFTLADFAFAVAANWKKVGTVAINSNVAFLGTAKGTRLVAEAVIVKNGRSTCYCNVNVDDDLGNKVAAVTITGFHKN